MHCFENLINPTSTGARVVILKAEGKHFSAGLNLESAAKISQVGDEDEEDILIHQEKL